MSITIQAADGSGGAPSQRDFDASGNNFVYSNHRLLFAGTYPGSPGDTIDLTPLAQIAPSGLAPESAYVVGNGDSTSQEGNGGYYTISLYNGNPPVANALTANKVRIWTAGGTELTNAAYPAAVLRDAVTMTVVWKKLAGQGA